MWNFMLASKGNNRGTETEEVKDMLKTWRRAKF
jgi:hypothetical protein